jgi:hypothetical protein
MEIFNPKYVISFGFVILIFRIFHLYQEVGKHKKLNQKQEAWTSGLNFWSFTRIIQQTLCTLLFMERVSIAN